MKAYIILCLIPLLLMGACSDSFLDTENYVQKDNTNFPSTPEDANSSLASIYAAMTFRGTKDNTFTAAEMMSDDSFGGGGANDVDVHGECDFTSFSTDMYSLIWTQNYQGIFRANMLLQNMEQITGWESDAQHQKVEGEVHFLRAYFYFDLARFFGNIPLVLSTVPVNEPQASADKVYAQIAEDLLAAIDLLPSIPFEEMPKSDLGRATKWAAQGMLSRVFLFYTGYYQKESLPLFDGELTKNEMISILDDCITNSGHKLIPDFRNQWTYAYANKDYKYARDNKLEWVREDGANTEAMFVIKFSTLGGITDKYCNPIVLCRGWRHQNLLPIGQGWGTGTVNSQLWDQWPDNDIRKKGTIMDVRDPEEGIYGYGEITEYQWGSDSQVEETGYWQKKYMPINVDNGDNTLINMSCELYGAIPNLMNQNAVDLVLLRFADVLLMGAELGGPHAQKYLDEVRGRVRLPSVPLTLENIMLERRYELAFECIRYYDLLRWHKAESAFAKVKDVPVFNMGKPALKTINFRPETGGFNQIPNNEILLSNNVLKQNPGW